MLLVLAGASSTIGAALTEKLAGEPCEILALRRKSCRQWEKSAHTFLEAGGRVTEVEWDATDSDSPERLRELLRRKIEGRRSVHFVYTAGRWWSGPVAKTSDAVLEDLTRLHFLSPARLLREVVSACRAQDVEQAQLIVVTGMGGERSVLPNNALYGASTTAIQNFVRSLAMELASTSYSAFCVALGLVDKGQPYIHDLCAKLVTGRPTPLAEVTAFLEERVRNPSRAFNGALVELSSGLLNYGGVCDYFESEKGGWT